MLGLSRPPRYHSRSRATSRAPGLGDARSQGDSFYRLHALNYHRKSHTRTPRTMDDSHPANTPPPPSQERQRNLWTLFLGPVVTDLTTALSSPASRRVND